jgi:hypothetical protein
VCSKDFTQKGDSQPFPDCAQGSTVYSSVWLEQQIRQCIPTYFKVWDSEGDYNLALNQNLVEVKTGRDNERTKLPCFTWITIGKNSSTNIAYVE